jgi:hypothetical protein
MSFLGASLASLDRLGGRESAAVLRWIHDEHCVRNASSTRRRKCSKMRRAFAVLPPGGCSEVESQHEDSGAAVCVRRLLPLCFLEPMSLRMLRNLR